MYQLIQAHVLTSGSFNNWEPASISSKRLLEIFQLYPACIVYVYDQTNDLNGWIDLYQLPVAIRTSVLTLEQYLSVAVGLPIVEEDPFGERGDNYVRYLFTQAYSFMMRGTNSNFSNDENLLPDQKTDILLYRNDITDYTSIVNKSLVTVNGLLFRAWPVDGEGILLNGAGKYASKLNDNRVGLIDFSNIGDIATYPITEGMIKGGGDSLPLYRGFFIDVDVSLSGKTPALVIAGKLYILDTAVQVIGETRLRIDMTKINLLNHYYETYEHVDYGTIPLSTDANDVDQTVAAEFLTDTVIKAFFTHFQSFLVTIDSVNLTKELMPLKHTHIPEVYLSPTSAHPDLPVVIGNGFISEYTLFERDGFWALSIPRFLRSNQFYETIPNEDRSLVRDQRYGYNAYRPAAANYLLIKKAATT